MKKVFGNSSCPADDTPVIYLNKTSGLWETGRFIAESKSIYGQAGFVAWETDISMWMFNSNDSVQIIDEGTNI